MHEKLEITNFLSISHLEWEPKPYNIITGEMGSGKSVCMKLLYFIYEIFNVTIFNESSFRISDINGFYAALESKFRNVFFIAEKDNSQIIYKLMQKKDASKSFDFAITIKSGKIKFSSKYVEEQFENWRYKLTESLKQQNIDASLDARIAIRNDISNDIGNFFPFGQLYFSDLRTLLTEPNTILTSDPYTNELLSIKGTLAQRFHRLLDMYLQYTNAAEYKPLQTIIKEIYEILHIKNVYFKNGEPYLVQTSDKHIPIEKASSGQREIFYLLSFMTLIHDGIEIGYYGKTNILFIEEPEVHLFPCEQKRVLEILTKAYRYFIQPRSKWRFFITTHSPYILNALNNMLFKSVVLKKCNTDSKKIEQVNAAVPFPSLAPEKVSAIFIKKTDNGCSSYDMIEQYEDTPFLFSEEIEKITDKINEDYNALTFLQEKLQ